ncbi:phage tail protein [Enterobacter hormaechei]|nr:phage tail protein [Enterobacter cloacae complex sp.]KAA0880067.1 phage tail protein [Enterobacter hormaechei]KLQ47184.1 phage tail assembly protein [Enterobacter hormaechei subsp. steigerwaltii]RTM76953.1 phage tail protein [Enterobacter hormaechei subsp. xiangfangensis]TCZ42662.1 phage tail protein [Enterobacter hormaechei]
MWCELVLNGIGGRTIAEAKERLSFREFQQWIQYRQKYGNLNPMMRTEWGAALVSSVLANVNRTKNTPAFSIADFAPHIAAVEREAANEPIKLEEAMRTWG